MDSCYIVTVDNNGMVIDIASPFTGDELSDTNNIEKQFLSTLKNRMGYFQFDKLTKDDLSAFCENGYAEFEDDTGGGSVQIHWEIG